MIISLGKFMSTQQTKKPKQRSYSDLNGIIKALSNIKKDVSDDEILLFYYIEGNQVFNGI